jgi:hypothetical protein
MCNLSTLTNFRIFARERVSGIGEPILSGDLPLGAVAKRTAVIWSPWTAALRTSVAVHELPTIDRYLSCGDPIDRGDLVCR